jgi:hypothetical protein
MTPVRRLQLFEIGEQPWCPDALRDALTDYLTFMIELGQPYAPAAPILAAAIGTAARDSSDVSQIVDLASGAGGPWRALVPMLAQAGAPVRVRLTDRFPNESAYARIAHLTDGRVAGEMRSVSADAVPADLAGFRTMFSAFHHFAPAEARRVLADAATHGASIAIFEATRRDMKAVLLMFLTPLFVLLATPFIRPFRLSRLVFTYVVPVVPLAVMFDGVVSCLRTYTPAELRALTEGIAFDGYTWTAGEVGAGPIPVTYLVGEAAVGAMLERERTVE